jgi:hypothetical protein
MPDDKRDLGPLPAEDPRAAIVRTAMAALQEFTYDLKMLHQLTSGEFIYIQTAVLDHWASGLVAVERRRKGQ